MALLLTTGIGLSLNFTPDAHGADYVPDCNELKFRYTVEVCKNAERDDRYNDIRRAMKDAVDAARDAGLELDGRIKCATCHDPARGRYPRTENAERDFARMLNAAGLDSKRR